MKKTLFLLIAYSVLSAVPTFAGIFTDNGDSTVTDAATGLMWQQTEGGVMNWEGALTYCEGLSLAGYSDWRLPNYKELESLTDDTLTDPAIDTIYFPNAHASGYCSSTTYAADPTYAWCIDFYGGSVLDGEKTSTFVRCVR